MFAVQMVRMGPGTGMSLEKPKGHGFAGKAKPECARRGEPRNVQHETFNVQRSTVLADQRRFYR
jgi:hypothetical protein